jgi:glycosyltransferase involved in cell wall biosynthesis
VLVADVVIPALNEERAIARVLDDIPRDRVRRIVVCDNGSTDRTAEVAEQHGAIVVHERERGYGAACLRALERLATDPPDVVVFLDGDRSDFAEELPSLVAPIEEERADLVIGSRALGVAERGSLTIQQRAGNKLAAFLLGRLYGAETTDLGPFRAIRWSSLQALEMRDRNYGWTVERQIKAAKRGLRVVEVPVRYRVRIGESKVSGTIRGTLGASRKILWTIARHAWR